MIHQETVLFDEMSLPENIYFRRAPRGRFGFSDLRAMRNGAAKILHDIRLRDLSTASRHLVAIAPALSIDAQVVIMDDSTAALSQKIEDLHILIKLLTTKKNPIHGKIRIIWSPADAVSAVIIYVPEDCGKQGASMSIPICQTLRFNPCHAHRATGSYVWHSDISPPSYRAST